MKIDSLSKNNFEAIGERTTLKFGIDTENMGLVYKSFINYSNPIGSLIRELASNCFDSHAEAGVNKPITIKITNESYLNGTPAMIHFIDYGVGLSRERVENIYCKFFTSTKRDTNNLIGGFGIGAKSPLGYVDMFYVKTVSDNVQYTYIVHKGESAPEMDLIEEVPTTESNGTEVIVNIKSGDKSRFLEEIKLQLKYFDNIEYVNCGKSDYILTREGPFISNNNANEYALDMCIGKVRYPIDPYTIKIPSEFSYSNLGLYFDIGEIDVVWNRESVEYSKKTIDAINAKITEGYNYIVNKIESIKKKITTIDEFLQLYKNQDKTTGFNVNIAGQELIAQRFLPTKISFEYESINYTFQDVGTVVQALFTPLGLTDHGRIKNSKNMASNIFNSTNTFKPYIVKGSTTPVVTFKLHKSNGVELYKHKSHPLYDISSNFQTQVENFVFKHIPIYDDVQITDKDREEYRYYLSINRKKKVTLSGNISYYPYTRGHYRRITDKASNIFKSNYLYVVGPASDSNNLAKLSEFLYDFYGATGSYNGKKKGGIAVLHFSKDNYETIISSEIPNVMFYGDFLKSKYMTRLIQRMSDYNAFRDIAVNHNFNETYKDNYFVKLYSKWNYHLQSKKIPLYSQIIKTFPPPHPELVQLKSFYKGVDLFIRKKAPLFTYIYQLKSFKDLDCSIKRDYDEYMKRFKFNNYKYYDSIPKNNDY